MTKFVTNWGRVIEVSTEGLYIVDTRNSSRNLGAALSHANALQLIGMLAKEFNMTIEEVTEAFEEATKPEKFYYKLPKGLHDSSTSHVWLYESDEYIDYYSEGKAFTEAEFNALLKTYPALTILDKFTEKEYEACDNA